MERIFSLWTDSPSVSLSVRMGGRCKSVFHSTLFDDLPPALVALESKIDETAYPDRWLQQQRSR